MGGKRLFLVLAGLGIGAAVFFLVRSAQSDRLYYRTPSEAIDRRAEFPDGHRFRLAGIVVPGSVVESSGEYRFDVTDGASDISVVLTSTPPQLFGEDVNVLLDGHWEGNVFMSEQALIRHEETYEAPPITAPSASG